jgi:hypothetical protein
MKVMILFTIIREEAASIINVSLNKYLARFFVALPPSRRNEWAAKMGELIRPGGYLIALVFPIDPKTDVGPPFYVRPEHFDELLSSNFEKVVDRVPETSLEGHKGRERVLVWRRKVD